VTAASLSALSGCHGRAVGVLPEDSTTGDDASSDTTTGDTGDGSGCIEGGDRETACLPVFDKCTSSKEIAVLGGGCKAVGVTSCADGFSADDSGGCTPIVATAAGGCSGPRLTIPGQPTCVPIGDPCTAIGVRWPDPPASGTVIYVDVGSTATTPDGTMANPY